MKSRSQRIHDTNKKISRRLHDYQQIFKVDGIQGESKRAKQPGRMRDIPFLSCNCRKRVKGSPHISCGICVERGLNRSVKDRRSSKIAIKKECNHEI